MALPVIPFAKLPRKNWEENTEKKERIEIIDPPSPEESSSEEESVSSSSSSEYDLIQHLSDLLPGELENGEKPKKQANIAHLEDLRVKRKPPDRLKYIKYFYGYIKQMRARERERRKHHILKEYEAKIKAYDEMLKKQVQDELEAKEKEVKLEAYRRLKRIERNSRKVRAQFSLCLMSIKTESSTNYRKLKKSSLRINSQAIFIFEKKKPSKCNITVKTFQDGR